MPFLRKGSPLVRASPPTAIYARADRFCLNRKCLQLENRNLSAPFDGVLFIPIMSFANGTRIVEQIETDCKEQDYFASDSATSAAQLLALKLN